MSKLLISPYPLRRASVSALRAQLVELQQMSYTGDDRPEVYATFVAVSAEIERRGLKARGRPVALISKGASKLMKIGDIRSTYEKLLGVIDPSTEQLNTRNILAEEMERRSMLAKRTYWKRREQAVKFLTFMEEQHGVEGPA